MKFVERAWTPLASILGEYEHYAIFARPLSLVLHCIFC